ncbi:MAG: hypothetical protein OD811_01010 [Alphaproteobacteria bacterium]
MAFPFGHPTLEEFVEYAKEHGCREAKGSVTVPDSEGRVYAVRSMIGANGEAVFLPVLAEDEKHLLPSEVESLCERLEIPLSHDINK